MCYQTRQEEKLLISCRLKFETTKWILKKHDCSNMLLVASTAPGSLSLLIHSSTSYCSSGVISIPYVYLPLYFLWTFSPCLPSSFLEKKKRKKTFNWVSSNLKQQKWGNSWVSRQNDKTERIYDDSSSAHLSWHFSLRRRASYKLWRHWFPFWCFCPLPPRCLAGCSWHSEN